MTRTRLERTLGIAVPAIALGTIVAVQVAYFGRGFVPGDAFTYLAAGERLNAGHPLYALSPGDRPVGLQPPFWTVPLLSPPPIAVLFRPLAAIPGELGVYLWWFLCIGLIAGTALVMLRTRRILVGVALLFLTVPIVYEIGVGNLNALLVAGVPAAWYLMTRGRDSWAGVLIAGMTALKLSPIVLAWWLITQRRWTALRAFIVGGLAIAAVSVLGAGLPAHLEYLGIARQTSAIGTSVLSLAGMARYIGVDPAVAALLPVIALLGGAFAVWALRDRPGLAYAVAIVTMVAGSPVVNINWFTVLLGALAPALWPMSAASTATGADDRGDLEARRHTTAGSGATTSEA